METRPPIEVDSSPVGALEVDRGNALRAAPARSPMALAAAHLTPSWPFKSGVKGVRAPWIEPRALSQR